MKPRILFREELAWAAGFFDGEGCVYLSKMNKQKNAPKSIHFDIAQIDPYVLERFKKAINLGKVYGPYNNKTKRNPNSRPYWRYTICGFEKCQAAVAMLWEWLSPIKREQATNALQGYINARN